MFRNREPQTELREERIDYRETKGEHPRGADFPRCCNGLVVPVGGLPVLEKNRRTIPLALKNDRIPPGVYWAEDRSNWIPAWKRRHSASKGGTVQKPTLLVALPPEHPKIHSVQGVLEGKEACSGTNGSIIRAAALFGSDGYDLTLSGNIEEGSGTVKVCSHEAVHADDYDVLITHQSHWLDDGSGYTFGDAAVSKSILWLHNHARRRAVGSFLQKGGLHVICPSRSHAGVYRPVRGFPARMSVVYNLASPDLFYPGSAGDVVKGRLLFIGAVTPTKGFSELMTIWSELARRRFPGSLAIAGSISLHRNTTPSHPGISIGVAEPEFEKKEIIPWLTRLPDAYKPAFLGALAPMDLRTQIVRSEAVIVNPSWTYPETFCCSAVDAQLCARPVFSVATGGLLETVYRGSLSTLSPSPDPTVLADLIEVGLSASAELLRTGEEARRFCLSRFTPENVRRQWDAVLQRKQKEVRLGWFGKSPREWLYDGLRVSGLTEILQRRPL